MTDKRLWKIDSLFSPGDTVKNRLIESRCQITTMTVSPSYVYFSVLSPSYIVSLSKEGRWKDLEVHPAHVLCHRRSKGHRHDDGHGRLAAWGKVDRLCVRIYVVADVDKAIERSRPVGPRSAGSYYSWTTCYNNRAWRPTLASDECTTLLRYGPKDLD